MQSTKNKDTGAKWKIGWRTPTIMVSCYVFGMNSVPELKIHTGFFSLLPHPALLLSTTHLLMFLFLDGKPIENYRQSYVTTASTILASSFGLSLQASLGIAFTQTLWSTLRKSPQTLRIIEDLFTMRANPLLALRWRTLQSAPLLSYFVLILWALQIATNFPPGALTVASKSFGTTALAAVITLNTSDIGTQSDAGNMDGTAASLNPSLALLEVVQNPQGGPVTEIQRYVSLSGLMVIF